LDETEGTEPSASDSPENKPAEKDYAQKVEGEEAGINRILEGAYGAGEGGEGAGIAIHNRAREPSQVEEIEVCDGEPGNLG